MRRRRRSPAIPTHPERVDDRHMRAAIEQPLDKALGRIGLARSGVPTIAIRQALGRKPAGHVAPAHDAVACGPRLALAGAGGAEPAVERGAPDTELLGHLADTAVAVLQQRLGGVAVKIGSRRPSRPRARAAAMREAGEQADSCLASARLRTWFRRRHSTRLRDLGADRLFRTSGKTFERRAGKCSTNGLRCVEYMIENHPPRRSVYGRDHPAARAPDEHERRARIRRAAEALFAPKPPITEQPVDLPRSPANPAIPRRSPRLARVEEPTARRAPATRRVSGRTGPVSAEEAGMCARRSAMLYSTKQLEKTCGGAALHPLNTSVHRTPD